MHRAIRYLRASTSQQPSTEGYQLLNMAVGHSTASGDNGVVGTNDVAFDNKALDGYVGSPDASSSNEQVVAPAVTAEAIHEIEATKLHWYSYFTTVDFWVIVALGQVLALCTTATNTFTTFLFDEGTSMPAFQTLFNYILLALIYGTFTLVRYGPRKLGRIVWRDGWKYFILSFLDVQGNYFTVLAYEYTNILSAQLLNFWSIVCVVIISFLFLRVRYRPFQILGILVCCGGMGLLLASDHMTGVNGGPGVNMLKGDLFGLLGASCYGLSNVFEEWFVSKRPMYEVLCFLGCFGMCINGVQAAIFDRASIQNAVWNGPVAGYLVGYTLALTLFYSLAPLILRMGSAAFFDISLLTTNFWGTIIGIHVFGLPIHYLYPIAFVLILVGLVVYFLAGSVLGDSKKPWLGAGQEDGVAGIGTAKLKAINLAKRQGMQVGEEEEGQGA
jgi:solute carrier family 35 protein F1/2